MPCMGGSNLTEEQRAERDQRRAEALLKLERELLAGRIKLVGDSNRPAFDGWGEGEREGYCDSCAYRALSAQGSSALRMAQSRQQPERMARRMTT